MNRDPLWIGCWGLEINPLDWWNMGYRAAPYVSFRHKKSKYLTTHKDNFFCWRWKPRLQKYLIGHTLWIILGRKLDGCSRGVSLGQKMAYVSSRTSKIGELQNQKDIARESSLWKIGWSGSGYSYRWCRIMLIQARHLIRWISLSEDTSHRSNSLFAL